MKIQFYISDEFSKYYLPFLIYRESLLNIIKFNYQVNIEYIYDYNKLTDDNKTIIIMNFYSLNNDLINILKSYSSIKVIINTEY